MEYQVFYPTLDYTAPLLFALVAFLLFAEYKWPLRRQVTGYFRRLLTNIGVAVPTMVATRLALIPAIVAAGYWAQQHGFGLLHLLPLPKWLHAIMAFLLLGYSLYIWHVLAHKVPLIWRFHNVHHIDLDLTVSTAIRFHIAEILLSAIFRAAAVLLLGAGPVVVLVYEVVFEASVAFHHSNCRLPFWLERPLSSVIVTPRMHGIHHSIIHRETDLNYSNIFNIWDRIHRSIRLNIQQDEITVGVPGYRDARDLTVSRLLALPFQRQHEYWKLPDGTEPDRADRGERDRLSP